MTTMARALRSFVEKANGGVTRKQIKEHIESSFPGKWTPGTLTAHLYACSVNNSKAYIHHKWADRFLYRSEDGRFHLYDPQVHGANTWAPSFDDQAEGYDVNDDTNIEELVETSITFERDVESYLERNLGSIEDGLRFIDRQVSI